MFVYPPRGSSSQNTSSVDTFTYEALTDDKVSICSENHMLQNSCSQASTYSAEVLYENVRLSDLFKLMRRECSLHFAGPSLMLLS